jgi:hypothetical protein
MFDDKIPDGSDSIFVGAISDITSWMGWWFDDTLDRSIADNVISVEMTGPVFGIIHVQVMEFIGVKQNSIVNTNTSFKIFTNRISSLVDVSSNNSLCVGGVSSSSKYIGAPLNLIEAKSQKFLPNSYACGYNLNVNGDDILLGWNSVSNVGAFVGATFESV